MGALDGLKILDFSTLLPGPFATLMLADMGAEVLKVSSKGKPDLVAGSPPFLAGGKVSANQAWLGRNKKTISLNLKHPEAVKIVKKLIMEYDIILEQFRPGVMEKLGLGYGELKQINPALIYCSLTGYGQTGPLRMNAGHDINYLARSGNMAHAGRRATGPVLTNIQIADVAAGSMNSVIGILAAGHYRHRTGKGQYVDVSMYDGLIPFNSMDGAAFLAGGSAPEREGQMLNGGYLYDFYETADGRYLSAGCLEPKFWANFCNCIGKPEYIEGTACPENISVVKTDIQHIIKGKSLAEWMEIFEGKDVCVEPVLSLEEALLQDSHMEARQMVVDVEIPNFEAGPSMEGCRRPGCGKQEGDACLAGAGFGPGGQTSKAAEAEAAGAESEAGYGAIRREEPGEEPIAVSEWAPKEELTSALNVESGMASVAESELESAPKAETGLVPVAESGAGSGEAAPEAWGRPRRTVKQFGTALKFSESPVSYRHCGYPIGFHTEQMMHRLGYAEGDIRRLESEGVFE